MDHERAAPVIKSLNDIPGLCRPTADTLDGLDLRSGSSQVFLEICEPGRAQPLGSPSGDPELSVVLSGRARAHTPDEAVDLTAGDVVVLRPGCVRWIQNVSETERLFTLTVVGSEDALAPLLAALRPRPQQASRPSSALLGPRRE